MPCPTVPSHNQTTTVPAREHQQLGDQLDLREDEGELKVVGQRAARVVQRAQRPTQLDARLLQWRGVDETRMGRVRKADLINRLFTNWLMN